MSFWDQESNRKAPAQTSLPAAQPSILAQDLHIDGNVITKGSVIVKAQITGNVTGQTVSIGIEGKISGDINANSLEVVGHVAGDVAVSELQIRPTGRVTGTVQYRSLTIETGATIEGTLQRSTSA